MSDYVEFENIYGQSENGNIQCVGIRLDDGSIGEMPMRGTRIDIQSLVGNKVVFYNKELNKYYDIDILEYIKTKNSRFVVKYKNEELKELQCGNLINSCIIGNVVNERLFKHTNKFYQVDNYYIMTIKVKDTVNEKYFDKDYVEVKFNGDKETVEAIKNSIWCINRHHNSNKKFYVVTNSYNNTGKKLKLHQVVFGDILKSNVIDHINGDTLDNRLENLRETNKKENSRNLKGAGFPTKTKNGWYYRIKVDGDQICTPTRKEHSQADIDSLIIQKHFNYKHREEEFYKLDDIDEQYKNELITLMEEKLEKAKSKKSIFTKNEYEIVIIDRQEVVKVYGKDKDTFTLIDKEDLWVLDKGRVFFTNSYWKITVNKTNLSLHRYILGIKETNLNHIQVDHLNQKPNDNRRSNLVITTETGNLANKGGVGYTLSSRNSFVVGYRSYFKYIKNHNSITKVERPTFKTEQEAKEEVYKRKYLALKIRPQFKKYEEYLKFEEEYNSNKKDGQAIDDYWISTRFPNINDIEIPKYK